MQNAYAHGGETIESVCLESLPFFSLFLPLPPSFSPFFSLPLSHLFISVSFLFSIRLKSYSSQKLVSPPWWHCELKPRNGRLIYMKKGKVRIWYSFQQRPWAILPWTLRKYKKWWNEERAINLPVRQLSARAVHSAQLWPSGRVCTGRVAVTV